MYKKVLHIYLAETKVERDDDELMGEQAPPTYLLWASLAFCISLSHCTHFMLLPRNTNTNENPNIETWKNNFKNNHFYLFHLKSPGDLYSVSYRELSKKHFRYLSISLKLLTLCSYKISSFSQSLAYLCASFSALPPPFCHSAWDPISYTQPWLWNLIYLTEDLPL